VSKRGFDVFSIQSGDGSAPNPRMNWAVHYIGDFEPNQDGTLLTGRLTITPFIRRFMFGLFLVGLTAIAGGIAAHFLPGVIIGFVLIAFISTMTFLSLADSDEWDVVPLLVQEVFAGHTDTT
jgi:hypothetical protein